MQSTYPRLSFVSTSFFPSEVPKKGLKLNFSASYLSEEYFISRAVFLGEVPKAFPSLRGPRGLAV